MNSEQNPIINQYYNVLKMRYQLTKRELDVIKVLSLYGKSNRILGEQLKITEKTMKNHIAHIQLKTGTHSTRELQALLFREVCYFLISSPKEEQGHALL